MNEFKIGDVVQMTGRVMTGNVGIVVHYNAKREQYLVRITDITQNYFAPEDLKIFQSKSDKD